MSARSFDILNPEVWVVVGFISTQLELQHIAVFVMWLMTSLWSGSYWEHHCDLYCGLWVGNNNSRVVMFTQAAVSLPGWSVSGNTRQTYDKKTVVLTHICEVSVSEQCLRGEQVYCLYFKNALRPHDHILLNWIVMMFIQVFYLDKSAYLTFYWFNKSIFVYTLSCSIKEHNQVYITIQLWGEKV